MKIDFKQNILNLLRTEIQIRESLVDFISDDETKQGKYCYCIEGLIALAAGGKVEHRTDYLGIKLLGRSYNLMLLDVIYNEIDLPSNVNFNFIIENQKELKITKDQLDCINERIYMNGYLITWLVLNDVVRLTFDQFYTLIELIDKQTR